MRNEVLEIDIDIVYDAELDCAGFYCPMPIALTKEEIEKRIKECFKEMKNGIANYFGEQRFGGIRQITHIVGKEFLKGRFKEGVMLYLTHTVEGEQEEIKKARERLSETGDLAEATRLFPPKFGQN